MVDLTRINDGFTRIWSQKFGNRVGNAGKNQNQFPIHFQISHFSFRIIINEVCEYSVHPENSDWTCFEQKAELDIKSFFGFEGTAEKLAVKEYSKSIGKSKDIMEHYIQVNT